MIVALAGHVDHGKTSIVRALTGVDTDRLQEEKRRGLTIDLGFAYADFGDQRIGFVDVPGHHRFIHNMVAGVTGHQHALLVIAADDGVMPQSREHLQIMQLLGLGTGVVAINKADRVNEARLAEVNQDIRALVVGSFLDGAETIAVSCATGQGIPVLRQHLQRATNFVPTGDAERPFRLPIDRAFTVRGSGVVVTGTVVDGKVRADNRLVLATSGKRVRVRGVRAQDRPASVAQAGDRAAVNLTGVDVGELARGDWLLHAPVREAVTRFAMRLRVRGDRTANVRHNVPVHVYHATSHNHGRVLLIDSGAVAPGAHALVDVLLDEPAHVKVGDRVVLREQDLQDTLGGGQVLDLVPAARRRSAARQARLAAIRPDDARDTLRALVPIGPVNAISFARQWNLHDAQVEALAASLDLPLRDGQLLAAAQLAEIRESARRALAAHHRAQPASPGLTAQALQAVAPRLRAWMMPYALQSLVDDAAVRLENGRYALAAHRAAVPSEVLRTFAEVRPMLDTIQPPSVGDMAKRLNRPFTKFEAALRPLAAFGLAERVSDNRYFLPERLRELADIATTLANAGPFTVRAFRDASGVGRNVVIEVLEHFDGKGFTRRSGDTREVVGDKEQAV